MPHTVIHYSKVVIVQERFWTAWESLPQKRGESVPAAFQKQWG